MQTTVQYLITNEPNRCLLSGGYCWSFNEGLSADTLKDISSGGLEQALSVSTESKTHDNMGIS